MIGSFFVLVTPFGDIRQDDLTEEQVAIIHAAVLRKNGDFDMRYNASRKARRLTDALIRKKEQEWDNERLHDRMEG